MRWRLSALAAAALCGCVPPQPHSAADIESLGMHAAQTQDAGDLRTLGRWAEPQSGPLAAVAARELGLALARQPGQTEAAVRRLTQAAQAGDGEAAYTLGEAHRTGGLGWTADPAAARPWFLQAQRAGHAGAMLALASAARNGDGEPRDLQRGFHLLQLASLGGNARAMYLLSQAYAQGEGTPPDPALARYWLEQSAELHLPAAMQDWALALEDGRWGVDPDAQAAREQWREAAEERRNRWNAR